MSEPEALQKRRGLLLESFGKARVILERYR